MRKVNDYTHIKRLFYIMVSSIICIVLLAVVLSISNTKIITKKKNNNESVSQSNILYEKYDLTKEPKVRVYFINEKCVREIPLETYVKGVVCSEMPVEFNIEALKAQAVAARTYALAHMKDFGNNQYNKRLNADVCDSIQSQVYMTKDKRIKSWPKSKSHEYWTKIEKVVEDTKGEFLAYDNDIVKAPYYFSTSNGKTENSEDVFSKEVPYLKSVESPGEEKAPRFKDSKKYTKDQFLNIIKKRYSNCSVKNMRNEVVIKDKTKGGSVKSVKVGNVTIAGTEFRKIFKLNSAKFSLEFKNKDIIINCEGYGHNVGMSQWGANSMGKSGKKYKEILIHYYTGVNIEKFKY
ncbi:stage II sporulation protein D [Clostridium niameyense]|uniref:stage II sporulation protein D n=1 Tax=Clostridium niameyense TaxID=1622073 RepID=UPI00067F5A30|nr:stage II sporulation protein D [Clostridium niameyense]